MRYLGMTGLIIVMLPNIALAQESQPKASNAFSDLLACRAIGNAEKRLACFDQHAGVVANAEEGRQIVVLDRNDMKRAKRNIFGFSLPKIKLFGESDKDEPEIEQIDGIITSSRSIGSGMWSFALEDGSVWQTTETKGGLSPSSGKKISIKAGLLGGYVAKFEGGRAVRVKRTR